MNTISKVNVVNFTAKMNVSNVENNKKRWDDIAKIFEQKTQDYGDKIVLSHAGKDEYTPEGRIELYAMTTPESDRFDEHCASISDSKLKKIFKNNSDETIANKFVKMLEIFRHNDAKRIEGNEFYVKFMKDDKYDDQTDFAEKFVEILCDKTDADMNSDINRDSVLKEFEVY